MADLNKIVKRVESGWDLEFYRATILRLIKNHETTADEPLCCFYICKPKEIPREEMLAGFRNHATSNDNRVIGCSRGCVPAEDAKQKEGFYREKLCDECVMDARRLLKGGGEG